ncbi:uncharacterized protein FA14DRAFT_141600 [Meira miltonrushii]|uniref:RRM domain-containing protein n=1 Tax=Meira miltonrushii TaxID=1280837 RepID=A0A316VLW8_9BASI|nr:uncharacterized protein FA14DRAFT_141600 [Meira miltonrushii]PWN37393.1 hypothetical protein FA14DRAFT_141600 [Meira miltonrushii]
MSGAQRGSRVVFVGNIPYDMSEEQLIEVFREVGTVVGFRLVFDRETGKPKGYGFCEFEDGETAASAVRNLNEKEVGGRPMRISFADVDPMFEGRTTSMGQVEGEEPLQASGRPPARRTMGPQGQNRQSGPPPQQPQQLPPNLPQGQQLQPGIGATDAISQTLAALPPNQLLDILSQMKGLATMNPDQAKILLNGHPQLAYALFQAMLMMNVVDGSILERVLTQSGALGVPPQQAPPQQQFQQHPPQGPPHMGYGQPPPFDGMHSGPYGGPPPPQQGGQVNNLPDDQRALLEEVLKLTPDQIAALPPDQREGILQLKASLGQV